MPMIHSAHIYIILSYFLYQYTQPFLPIGSVIQSPIKNAIQREDVQIMKQTYNKLPPLPTQ